MVAVGGRPEGGVVFEVAEEVFAEAAGSVLANVFGVIREVAESLGLDSGDSSGEGSGDTGEDLAAAALGVVGVGGLQRGIPVPEVIGGVAEGLDPELILVPVVDFLAVGEVGVDGENALGADVLLELGVASQPAMSQLSAKKTTPRRGGEVRPK